MHQNYPYQNTSKLNCMNTAGDRFYIYFPYTGYIKSLIAELWSVLECGASDTPLFTPKSWSVDAIDRSSHKVNIKIMLHSRDISTQFRYLMSVNDALSFVCLNK